jgi:hypothetical protein
MKAMTENVTTVPILKHCKIIELEVIYISPIQTSLLPWECVYSFLFPWTKG